MSEFLGSTYNIQWLDNEWDIICSESLIGYRIINQDRCLKWTWKEILRVLFKLANSISAENITINELNLMKNPTMSKKILIRDTNNIFIFFSSVYTQITHNDKLKTDWNVKNQLLLGTGSLEIFAHVCNVVM